MSLALVRQALKLVDEEEISGKHSKRYTAGSKQRGSRGQDRSHQHRNKIKKTEKQVKSEEQRIEDNIKKLLALSEPAADKDVTETILKRAVKGQPLLEEKIKKGEEEKSILFPEDEEVKPAKKSKRK